MTVVNKLAFALGLLLTGNYALAHGHHSHGAPLTEIEQKAAKGIFDDDNVKDRSLTDWDGIWQSVYPLLQSGDLDPVFEMKAKKNRVNHLRILSPIISRDIRRILTLSVSKMVLWSSTEGRR